MINVAPDNWRELYRESKDNPCGAWMFDLPAPHGAATGRHECELPLDHEDKYDLPHMSFTGNKAWQDGLQSGLWFKDMTAPPPPAKHTNVTEE